MNVKKNSIIGLIICFSAILFATNPEESKHREEAKKVLREDLQTRVESKDDQVKSLIGGLSDDDDEQTTQSTKKGGLFSTIFNSFLGDAVVDNIVDEIVYAENCGLFSLTKIKYNGEEATVGFGVLGNVFISDKFNEVVSAYLHNGE